MNIFPLDKFSYTFPSANDASPQGVVAYGGDLNPNRIIKAYMNGIFPWYNEGDPILWWSPNPRFVLFLEQLKVSKSLQKTIDKNIYEIKFDSNFNEVMTACATMPRNGQEKTWILPEIVEANEKLFEMGFAHSFEAYFEGELVGGGYGIVIGNIFCGQSMFAKKSDASKVAFYHLVQHLKEQGFILVDCQIPTPHLESLGAQPMLRKKFLEYVKEALKHPKDF